MLESPFNKVEGLILENKKYDTTCPEASFFLKKLSIPLNNVDVSKNL